MTKLSFSKTDSDGVVSTGRLIIGDIVIETPAVFPAVRTTQAPNELELLINEKGKYMLEHVNGAVLRLYHVPTLIEPNTARLAAEERQRQGQKTIDGAPIPRSPYGTFYNDSLPICDPCLEYTKILNSEMDKRMARVEAVPVLHTYFAQFERNKNLLENPDDKAIRTLR